MSTAPSLVQRLTDLLIAAGEDRIRANRKATSAIQRVQAAADLILHGSIETTCQEWSLNWEDVSHIIADAIRQELSDHDL